MFGVTISLTEKSTSELEEYLKRMKNLKAEAVFASVQIPEENAAVVKDNLFRIGAYIKEEYQEFVVDISPRTFRNFSPEELREAGVTSLRIDNGMTEEEIVQLSKQFKIVLNASIIDSEQIEGLRNAGYEGELEAWYNYYPRNNTGLAVSYFKRQNEWLKSHGIKTGVFIAGDKELRGTIFEGLPTLEVHRKLSPFLAYLEMNCLYGMDKIVLGDFDLQQETFRKMEALLCEGCISLQTEQVREHSILNMLHHNRVDVAEDVIRSNEYRRVNKKHFEPENTSERKPGSITIDNAGYGRYMGEMQIVLTELEADDRVNVAGKIADKDVELLSYIKEYGYSFRLTEKSGTV